MPGTETAMNSNNKGQLAIQLTNLGKCYNVYSKPKDRIKQLLWHGRKQYYKEFWALRNINLEIEKGDQLSIIGMNGSGKSTLLQLICGTLRPTEGEVFCNGRIAALLELGSGFNPEFTGMENIYLNAALLGLSSSQINEKLDNILAFADIGDFIDQPVKIYSSGMQVRLAFAVIANVDADILVCDEALAVGDAVFIQRCMRFIRSFRETGTLLFVSHEASSVSTLTNNCLWIHKGDTKFYGDTKQAIQRYAAFCQHESGFRQVKEKIKKPILLKQVNSDSQHSDGEAEIVGFDFIDDNNNHIEMPGAGDSVRLIVKAVFQSSLFSPFVGYQITNSKGLVVFADNTLSTEAAQIEYVESGNSLQAVFHFNWPSLSFGHYSITLAVSSGTRDSHINHHWVDDVMIFEQAPLENYVHGIFKPNMVATTLEVYAN